MDAYSEKMKSKMNEFAHGIYGLTKKFPKDEMYGITSQLRRASLSVVLNYIEGYARKKSLVKKNFWEISYGSLQESKYLIDFSFEEGLIVEEDHIKYSNLGNEIGAMLWKSLVSLRID